MAEVLRCRVDAVTSAGCWVTAPGYGQLGPLEHFGGPQPGIPALLIVLPGADMVVLADATRTRLQQIAAASTDFTDFKTRIAAW